MENAGTGGPRPSRGSIGIGRSWNGFLLTVFREKGNGPPLFTQFAAREDSVFFGALFGHVVTICGRQYLRVYDDAQCPWHSRPYVTIPSQYGLEGAMSCHFCSWVLKRPGLLSRGLSLALSWGTTMAQPR